MSWLWVALSRIAGLFVRSRHDDELDEEMRSHIEMLADEYVRRGMNPQEAKRAARRSFGGIDQTKESYRSQRSLPMVETFMQDFRYAFRMLTKNVGFSLVAIIALALGIGANTAIFSVINAVMLRPLPFKDPNQLFALYERNPKVGYDQNNPSIPDMIDWRNQSDVFDGLAMTAPNISVSLAGDNSPEHVNGSLVSAGLFQTLKVDPIKGRVFLPEEEDPGKSHVAIIGYGLWERRYGKDPNIVGRTVTLNGTGYTVVGIMPPGFQFPGGSGTIGNTTFAPQPADVWLPLALTPNLLAARSSHSNQVVARLKPGVTLQQAQAEMNTIQGRIGEAYPKEYVGTEVKFVPLNSQVSDSVRPVLMVLLGAVAFVLLIACVNVANLLLARANSRQKEIAIRAALGASRRRVIRQLLTESLLLSLAGGALGILLAEISLRVLTVMLPSNFPRADQISIDWKVLLFTLLVSLSTGILFGLVPAFQASRYVLTDTLKDAGRGSTEGFRHNRFRSLLIVVEIALSLVLLVGAGLMMQSFLRLQKVSLGFNPDHVLTTSVSLPRASYPDGASMNAFIQRLVDKVGTIPGVLSSSAAQMIPLVGNNFNVAAIVDGRTYPPNAFPNAEVRLITQKYFDTMKIPLIRGRLFNEHDTSDSQHVILINQAMARRTFPGEDPIGKHLTLGISNFQGEIIGVVGDVREWTLDSDIDETAFCLYSQAPYWRDMYLTVRTASDPMSIAGAVRSAVWSIDKNQATTELKTMDDVIAESVSEPRLQTLLLGLFAAIALVLAAVGIYGVMSYSASQRTHEIGIRMALGADRSDVLKLVVGQGMLLVAIGVILGLVGSFALTRTISSLLYDVKATDPLTFAGTAAVLLMVAIFACYIPARRASKVDPMIALRYE